jgi:hypothetical protein
MRQLGLALACGLLLFTPGGAAADPDVAQPVRLVEATCAPDELVTPMTADDAAATAPDPNDATQAPETAQATQAPQTDDTASRDEERPPSKAATPTPTVTTRTIGPPTVNASPFAPPPAQPSSPENERPQPPVPPQRLPPGPPNRYP